MKLVTDSAPHAMTGAAALTGYVASAESRAPSHRVLPVLSVLPSALLSSPKSLKSLSGILKCSAAV